MDLTLLKMKHEALYARCPTHYFASPGRVNLIGEHTDYSRGYVLPMAIEQGTYASVSLNALGILRIYSANYPHIPMQTVRYDDGLYTPQDGYVNYLKGMVLMLSRQGHVFSQGLDVIVQGDLPTSAGLSSSASFELLMGQVLLDMHDAAYEKLDVVKAAKAVENDFLGLQSGIMDQYAIMFAKHGHALLLDTGRLEHTAIPFDYEDTVLVMMNTNKQRNLTKTDYNERVRAVHAALDIFKPLTGAEGLCDVARDVFEAYVLENPTLLDWDPARHVVFEHARTYEAATALKRRDMTRFGALMNASHDSLRDLFKVSCAELDFLVSAHRDLGALGARMTGAGFGGTMIALYRRADLPRDFTALSEVYDKQFDLKLDCYYAAPSDGVRQLKEGK